MLSQLLTKAQPRAQHSRTTTTVRHPSLAQRIMKYDQGESIKVSEVAPHVLLVELARPPINIFNQSMWEELGATFDKISGDGEVRAVVLGSNVERVWAGGLDLRAVSTSPLSNPEAGPARTTFALRPFILDFQDCISAIERCRQPVIGAAHGPVIGLGIDILCACDIRYASENAYFSIRAVDVGMAADIGTLARLPKIIGHKSALRELALTARTFKAPEAKQLGFVSEVVPGGRTEVQAAAVELAKVIASKSPVAIAGTKHLLLHARDHTVNEDLQYTATWNAAMLQAEDMQDAMVAFKTRKSSAFGPLPSKL